MSVVRGVFLFVVMCLCVVGFVTLMYVIQSNNAPVDATINSTQNIYYDQQQMVNKTLNQTLQYGNVGATFMAPLPILVMIFVVAGALFCFMLVVKKR